MVGIGAALIDHYSRSYTIRTDLSEVLPHTGFSIVGEVLVVV